jgi:hypothetical protein
MNCGAAAALVPTIDVFAVLSGGTALDARDEARA